MFPPIPIAFDTASTIRFAGIAFGLSPRNGVSLPWLVPKDGIFADPKTC